jgi:RTA1 like protein
MVQSASATDTTGEHVIIGGLFVQIAFFCFFIVAAVTFQRRIYRMPTLRSEAPTLRWRKHLFALYAASSLILVRSLVRSLVRFIEYIQGQNGYIIDHEAFIYIFDGVPMLIVLTILIVVHPSEINGWLGRGRVASTGYGLKYEDIAPAP